MNINVSLKGAVLGALLVTAACVSPYEGQRTGYFLPPGETLTPEVVHYQDTEVKPRCDQWTGEVLPSDGEMMLAHGFNNLVGGAIGGTGGQAAATAIVGGTVSTTAALAGGGYYGIAAGAVGAINGKQASDYNQFAFGIWCEASDAGGYKFIPPSHGDEVVRTGQPRTYRSPYRSQQGGAEYLPAPPPPQ